jgi:hypothetical protein
MCSEVKYGTFESSLSEKAEILIQAKSYNSTFK